MKTPMFVSRFTFDSVTAELRAERDRAIESERRVLDRFFKRATGEPVFYPEPEEVEAAHEPEVESDDPRIRAKQSLLRSGIRPTPSQITQFLERESAREFAASRPSAITANKDIPSEMQAAQEAGRVAASHTVNT